MGQIASAGQLRLSFARWALVAVPAVVFLGFLSGTLSNSGYGNAWFDALKKPPAMPPGPVFGIAWAILYVLIGVAFAIVLNARGARLRGLAIALFLAGLALNLAWSPLFFAAHRVMAAFVLILAMFATALATTLVFGRIRPAAAWLMTPYLAWLCFAAILNWQTHVLNPDAERLVPERPHAQIEL